MPSSSATEPSSSLTVVESIKCDTCGFVEEYTQAYIYNVKERHKGHWICGLCADAVKEEVRRSPTLISVEEALLRHKTFCQRFRSPNEEEYPISLTGRILRRSLDGSLLITTTRTRSSEALPEINGEESRRSFPRSGSWFPSLC